MLYRVPFVVCVQLPRLAGQINGDNSEQFEAFQTPGKLVNVANEAALKLRGPLMRVNVKVKETEMMIRQNDRNRFTIRWVVVDDGRPILLLMNI